MKNGKKWIRAGILLIIAVALAFGLEAVQIATQPRAYEAEERVIREAGELEFEQCELVNAELKKEALATKADGSEILVDFGEERLVSRPEIWSKKVQKSDVDITLYWAKDGEDFAEERSATVTAASGGKGWVMESVPEGNYRKLRFRVDGKMTIQRISYSGPEIERVEIPDSMHMNRVLILIPCLFLLLLFLTGVHAGRRFLNVFRHGVKGLTADGKSTLVHCATFVIAAAAGYFLVKLLFLPGGLGAEMNWPRQLFCAAAALVPACLLTFRKTLGIKPEVLFVAVCLSCGSLMVFLYPDTTLVGLDDGFHYGQALNYSYLGNRRMTSQDANDVLQEVETGPNFELGEERDAWRAKQEARFAAGATDVEEIQPGLSSVYEIFAGTGLFLGRVLRLNYYWTFCLGKLFNLLAYTMCGYFGMKRLKSGKMILAAAMLIPTSLFQAGVYSYDPGLNAFAALGMAYWAAEWQEPEKRLTWGNALVIAGSLLFGCLTKAVYVPMLFLALLLPKSKFAPKGEAGIRRLWYTLLIAAVILILLATFLVPMLGGTLEGDDRGDADMDPYAQLQGIFRNPFGYLGVLFGFLGNYLSVGSWQALLETMGYMGYGNAYVLCACLLAAAAFLDKEPADRRLMRSWGTRILGLLFLFGTVAAFCTTMYMAYTAVGADSIAGVQPRYLLPVVFPSLMLLGSGLLAGLFWQGNLRGEAAETGWGSEKANRIKRQAFNGLTLALAAYVLLEAVYATCVSQFI